MNRKRCLTAFATLSMLVLHFSSAAAAGITLYNTGFERPTFVPGPLVGQDGWFAGLGPNAATVSTELSRNGSQSARVDGSLAEQFFGFYFASYARELNYDPLASGTPILDLSGDMNLTALALSCGVSYGLTGILDGELFPNALIGIREQNGVLVSYLSNADGVFVKGAAYEVGNWANVRAVFDFQARTVTGFFNNQLMGVVPFSNGISNDVFFVNMALGSSQPIPNVTAYFDDLSVTATAVPEPLTFALLGVALVGFLGRARRQ